MTENSSKPSNLQSAKQVVTELGIAGSLLFKAAKYRISAKIFDLQTQQAEKLLIQLQKAEQEIAKEERTISQSQVKLAELKAKKGFIITGETLDLEATAPVNLEDETISLEQTKLPLNKIIIEKEEAPAILVMVIPTDEEVTYLPTSSDDIPEALNLIEITVPPAQASLLDNPEIQALIKKSKGDTFYKFMQKIDAKTSLESKLLLAEMMPEDTDLKKEIKNTIKQAIEKMNSVTANEQNEVEIQAAAEASESFLEEKLPETVETPEILVPKSESEREVENRIAKAKTFFKKAYTEEELLVSYYAIKQLLDELQAKQKVEEKEKIAAYLLAEQQRIQEESDKEARELSEANSSEQKPTFYTRLKEKVAALLFSIKSAGQRSKDTIIVGPVVALQNNLALQANKDLQDKKQKQTKGSFFDRRFWIGAVVGGLAFLGFREANEIHNHTSLLANEFNSVFYPQNVSTATNTFGIQHSAIIPGVDTNSKLIPTIPDFSNTTSRPDTVLAYPTVTHITGTTEAAIVATFPGAEFETITRQFRDLPNNLSHTGLHIDQVGQHLQLHVTPELLNSVQHTAEYNPNFPTEFIINIDANQTEVVRIPAGSNISTIIQPGQPLYDILKNYSYKTIEYGQKVGNIFTTFSTAVGKAE